jgi:DNA-binding transcriptional LysR family regulator
MNLVVALRALLAERNVTRAGERIGVSQPAMSAALARLRRHFGDELLARKGSGYELTVLGVVLLDRTEVACGMLELVFGSQARFDPAREHREFVLFSSDYAVTVIGDRLAPPRWPPSTACSCRTASSAACPPSSCFATAGCARWPRTTPR